jgi:hypothetical protein
VIVDGTLTPTDRIAADEPYHSEATSVVWSGISRSPCAGEVPSGKLRFRPVEHTVRRGVRGGIVAKVTLSEALAELREELYKAADTGGNEQFRFEVEQAELCLEVEFRKDGNGKVNVEVGAFGAKGAVEAGGGGGGTQRQTLTLTLNVRDEALGGQPARIRRHETPGGEPRADVPPGGDA